MEAGVKGHSQRPSAPDTSRQPTHVGPAGDLDNHVEDGLGLIGEQGDVAKEDERVAVSSRRQAGSCSEGRGGAEATHWNGETTLLSFSMKTRCSG